MNPIDEARELVMSKVQSPALACASLPREAKAKVRSSTIWLSKFKRIGDLVHYLNRFSAADEDPLYREMKKHGLHTFEDLAPEFREKYGAWAEDRTRASDFVIGQSYSPHEILIFAKTYDTRSGGMFVINGGSASPGAVLIKATLKNGRYQNEWLEEGRRLKYYFKAINNQFGPHFKPNAAILNNPTIPILTFVRVSEGSSFVYYGVFRFDKDHEEPSGARWFELVLSEVQGGEVLATEAFLKSELERRVQQANSQSRERRLARLKNAPRMPATINVVSTAYVRNPDVVAEVLYLAQGVCGGCHSPAPFLRVSDNTPYLEVHHRIPLAQGGEDTVENAIALCPNCHRKWHFG